MSEYKYAWPITDQSGVIKDGFYNVNREDGCYFIGACWATRKGADKLRNKDTIYRIRVKVKR